MATVAEVYDGTLELLGILGLGQTINSTDSARMVRAYDQVFDDLKEESIATWASAGPVPDKMVPHLEALMAMNAADTYYVSAGRYQRIAQKSSVAKREMRRLSIADYESLENPRDF